MLDIGWAELGVIAVVALIVIGPKDLPRVLYNIGKFTGRARGMLREFQQGIEDMAREAELDDMRKKLDQARSFDVGREIEKTIDPHGELAKGLDPTVEDGGARAASANQDERAADKELASPPSAPAEAPADEPAPPRPAVHPS